MDKNIYIILLLVLAVVFGGYYYYQSTTSEDRIQPEEPAGQSSGQSDEQPSGGSQGEILEGGRCQPSANIVLDGAFEKVENGVFHFTLKNKQNLEMVNLNDETVFSEILFSADLERISDKEISLADLAQGDQVSLLIACGQAEGDPKVATAIRRIEVEARK